MSCVLKRGVANGNAKGVGNTNHDRRRGARFSAEKERLVRDHLERVERWRKSQAERARDEA